MVSLGISIVFFCASASGDVSAGSPAKSSLMRAEQNGARSVTLSPAGLPVQVAPAHSAIETHSFAVDARGRKVLQKQKKQKTTSAMNQMMEKHDKDCQGDPDDPLCGGAKANSNKIVDVQTEMDLTEQLVNGLSLYCCCGNVKASQPWQEHLRKSTVPDYCKKSWYSRYCTKSPYSPGQAQRDPKLERQEQDQMCSMCNECFQQKCSFWPEDQKPVKKVWIDTISCQDATTQFEEPKPILTNPEIKEDLEEADACAKGSLSCPSNISLAIQEFPIAMALFAFFVLMNCVAGVYVIKSKLEPKEDLEGEEQDPILDTSLISEISEE